MAGEHLQQAIDHSSSPMAVMTGGKIFYTNAAFVAQYGNVEGKTFAHFFNSEYQEQLQWLIARANGEADKLVLTLKEGLKSKHAGKDIMVQIWPVDGDLLLLSMQRDYSLNRLADLDELTRLPNRRKATMLLDIEKARVSRGGSFFVSLADIDRFKRINDTFGHDVGDLVLQHVSREITSLMRQGDWVARWGGEEFLIFINNNDLVTAIQPIERIRNKLEATPIKEINGEAVTMSFGLAEYNSEKELNEVINKADAMLYEAKRNGRNRVEYVGKEIVWDAKSIRDAVADGGLRMGHLQVYDWAGKAVMSQLVPHLKGHTYADTQRMLVFASRLNEQMMVDRALMAIALETHGGGGDGGDGDKMVFPLRENLCIKHKDEVADFLKKLPALMVGVSPDGAPSQEVIDMFIKSKKSLVLYDYDVKSSPPYLLGLPGVSNVVFADAEGAGGIIQLLKSRGIKCYLQLPAAPKDKAKSALQKEGFDGWQKNTA